MQSTAERLSGSDALIAVDAISSLAAVPLETDDWGLDIVLTSSHKALMCPAGWRSRPFRPQPRRRRRPPRSRATTWTGSVRSPPRQWGRRPSRRRSPRTWARRGPRPHPRRRARRRPRAAPTPRPRRTGRRQGDGARAVLAGRGQLGRGHCDSHASGDRRAGDRGVHARPLGRHDYRGSRRATREDRPSDTSATWTCTATSRRALEALERALVEAGADIERGTAVPAALEAHAEPVAA